MRRLCPPVLPSKGQPPSQTIYLLDNCSIRPAVFRRYVILKRTPLCFCCIRVEVKARLAVLIVRYVVTALAVR